MQVTLTPQAEQLLRQVLAGNPGLSAEQIIEQALAASLSTSYTADPVWERLKTAREVKVPDPWPPRFTSFEPIKSAGEPVSEQLIRERR